MSLLATTPESIGPYRVLRPVARGGMAEVFEVQDPSTGEHLALKLLVHAGSALPRFNREYEALARLNHPGIVRVYHYGLHQGQPWLTMELLAGVALQTWVKSFGTPGTPARTREVMRLAYHLADALDYLHNRGLVHRDLKSANVVMLPDGRLKLLDFGTAHLRDAMEQITGDDEFVGTFAYASPEQIRGEPIDGRSDLYSLGVLLYRLFTGRRAFQASDPAALARMQIEQAPVPLRQHVPQIEEGIERLVSWMMEKKRSRRPARAALVAAALQDLAGDRLSLEGGALAVITDRPVGREREERAIWDALEERPPGLAILVRGDEGSGRERFLDGLVREAERRGWHVHPHRFAEGERLDGLLEITRRAASAAHAPDPAANLPRGRELEDPRWRPALVRALKRALVAQHRTIEAPVLFVIQRMDVASPAAVEVLATLRREVKEAGLPIAIVAGCGKVTDEREDPLRQRFPDAHRIDLDPLGVREVALAVASLLHRRPPPEALARRIHAAAGGQPAYVEDVVRQVVDSGLVRIGGAAGDRLEWKSARLEALPLSSLARQQLLATLGRLPVIARRILEALALLDEEADVAQVADALGRASTDLDPLLEVLVGDGWVRVEQGRVRWSRPLAARLVRETLHPCRRHVLERAIAQTLAEAEPSVAKVRALITAGRRAEAVGPALVVAGRLLDRGRAAAALELLDAIGAASGDLPENDEVAELLLLHANLLLMIRPTDATGLKAIATAIRIVEDPLLRARIELARARQHWAIGHYPNYRRHLQQAWDRVEPLEAMRFQSVVASQLAWSEMRGGQPKSAADWFEKARHLAVRSGHPVAVAHAEAGLAGWLFAQGELDRADARASEAMKHFEECGGRQGLWGAVRTWTEVLRHQGRWSEALGVLRDRLPEAREDEAGSHYVRLVIGTAWCELDLYRLGRAQECIDELDATVSFGEHLDLRLEAGLVRGRILLASGQVRESAAVLQETHQRARAAEQVVASEHARALLAEALWVLGEREEARRMFQSAMLGLMGTGDRIALAHAVVARARVLAAEEDPDQLFAPARPLLEGRAALPLRLEGLLAHARYQTARGDRGRALGACREAALVLNRIASRLDDTDRAALRVHPWSRWIRRAIR